MPSPAFVNGADLGPNQDEGSGLGPNSDLLKDPARPFSQAKGDGSWSFDCGRIPVDTGSRSLSRRRFSAAWPHILSVKSVVEMGRAWILDSHPPVPGAWAETARWVTKSGGSHVSTSTHPVNGPLHLRCGDFQNLLELGSRVWWILKQLD